MRKSVREGIYISVGCGENYSGDTNPMSNSQNSMSSIGPLKVDLTNSGPSVRVTKASSSVDKPLSPIMRSHRSFPRSSVKHVRLDSQRPTSLEGSWHSRSSSEHSYFSQNFRPQGALIEFPATFAPTPSTLDPQQVEDALTSNGRSSKYHSESRRIPKPTVLNQASSVSTMAGNMYSQLSALAQLQSRSPAINTTVPLRGSGFTDGRKPIQKMYVNGVEQPELSSNKEIIKRRLLEDYQFTRAKEADKIGGFSNSVNRYHYPTPSYYGGLTQSHDGKEESINAIERNRQSSRKSKTLVIPSHLADNCMTKSEYNDRIMDYRCNSTATMIGTGNTYNDYPSGSVSAVISPTGARGSVRSVGQPSPSSVIEELQGRFQNSAKVREKRPILKNAPVTSEYASPVHHRRTATTVSSTSAALTSRPHHQSELTLPTTISADLSFASPSRTINTASTAIRLDSNGAMRAVDTSTFRGGPSFRRLQTLYGTNNNQKRYPSDNALDMSYSEEKVQQPVSLMPQFYVSGRKAGTVKIAVRSRSEQTSPTNGPLSPWQIFKAASSAGGTAFDDQVRSEQVIVPQTAPPRNNASFSADRLKHEGDENLTLPSVREIIRQVEEMTLKNNNSAHNSINSLTHSHSGGSSLHISRSLSRPLNLEVHDGANNRSLSASSAQTNGGTLGRTHNNNGACYSASSNSSDYDSHTVGRGQYATTRRGEFDLDSRKKAGTSAFHIARKGEMIANLPQDYQKLLEAFLEQRKEIQRLRKEMVDKDRLIASLQKDIHLYEPWR